MLEQNAVASFKDQGFIVIPKLFSKQEVDAIKAHFMTLNALGKGRFEGDNISDQSDPLARYPRMVHPHRWDKLSLDWLLDKRLRHWTTTLLGREPYAAQTMFYFKPPGARGQALHQDQRSLEVHPGTCLAAWMAVDACDEENGCLELVPGTQNLPKLCPVHADTTASFTEETVPLSSDMRAEAVPMQAGDVLFFNGQVINGSGPNQSKRFRCSLIAHYVMGDAKKVAAFYHPLLTFAGEEITLATSELGGPCGVWVSKEGKQSLELNSEPNQASA